MNQVEIEKKEKRQREGIQAKKERGEWDDYGRPAVITVEEFTEKYQNVVNGEMRPFQLMKQLGMSKSTFYRYVKKSYKSLRKISGSCLKKSLTYEPVYKIYFLPK